jgi:hypothetical protein
MVRHASRVGASESAGGPLHHGKPTEGAWAVMKNSLGNLAPGTTDQLAAAMRHQLASGFRRELATLTICN